MNLEQVAQFVKNPQQLDLSHAESLKILSDKNPYTSVYPLLYLTALSNGKSPDLDEALAKYAFKISDRTRLYHLLKGEKQNTIVPVPEDITVAEEIPVISPEAEKDVAETEPSTDLDKEDTLISQPILNDPDESPESDVHDSPERKTEAEIGFDFEKVTTAHSLEQYLEVEETAQTEELTGTDEPQKTVAEELPEEIPAVDTGLKSFGSWLRSGNSIVKKEPGTAVVPKANELIEKFIQQEPSISRIKKEFFSPSRKAKESLNEDAVPVSETLARIYAAQGNYPKAIHVYHQLMLSIPEKKSFFAIQIEELKQKITS